MDTIIAVSWCTAQGRFGYQISIIKEGKEDFQEDVGPDPGNAAAKALIHQSRCGGKIIGDSKIMNIIDGVK